MSGQAATRVRITLRWLQILDKLEPFFKDKGEFVFTAKVSAGGGQVQETRMPAKGHYPISDHPRSNRLNDLDKVIFEGDVADDLTIELRGEELDQFSKNDQLDRYTRTFAGPISDHIGVIQPGDEGSDDPENMSNWRDRLRNRSRLGGAGGRPPFRQARRPTEAGRMPPGPPRRLARPATRPPGGSSRPSSRSRCGGWG